MGYAKPDHAIWKLYETHKDEFTADMTALVKLPTEGGEQEVRIFSPRGCYALAMFARTKIAKEFRRWVLDVLESLRKTGRYEIPTTKTALPGKLTAASQDLIKSAIRERAESLPKEKWKGATLALWSALNAKFGTKGMKDGYKNIPDEALSECLSVIARTPLSGEYIAQGEPEPAVISEALQAHINRKTHQVAIGQYESIRGIITDAVQSNLNCGASEEDAHGYIESYGDAASDVTVINNRDLYMLAIQTTNLLHHAGSALETIHRLEKHLGREIYSRKKPDRFGCYGLPMSLVESVLNAAKEQGL